MPSSNKTDYLKLNRWINNDTLQVQDFIDDNEKIDAEFLTRGVNVEWFPRIVPENDDTGRIQRAIDSLGADGGVILLQESYNISSSLNITKRNITLLGSSTTGTILNYTANDGCLIKINSFDGNVDYIGGTTKAYGLKLYNLTLSGNYDATKPNQTSNCIGIVDYEGGSNDYRNISIKNFKTGFWGIGSDINNWENVTVSKCNIGVDLKNVCDQQTFTNFYGYGNVTQLKVHMASNILIQKGIFVDNIGPDVVISGDGTRTDIVTGNPYTSGIVGSNSDGITFDTCWFEIYRDKNGGQPWEVGQPTKDCFVELGVNNTDEYRPVVNAQFKNIYVMGIPYPTTVIANSFIRQKYAINTNVKGITYNSIFNFPVIKSEFAGFTQTNSSYKDLGTNPTVENFVFESNNLYTPPTIKGDTTSPLVNYSKALKRSIINNPTFINSAYGWTLSGTVPLTVHTPTATEKLYGNAIKITSEIQYKALKQLLADLNPYSAYEMVIRYKTNTNSAKWQFKIVENATQNPKGNNWARELLPQDEFSEVRFLIHSYGEIVVAPRLDLVYLGTNANDYIIIDYIDVLEVTPISKPNNGRQREFWGTAAPTSGTWIIGDVVNNTTPAAGGYMGWVCVTAGTPGTWKGFGTIQA